MRSFWSQMQTAAGGEQLNMMRSTPEGWFECTVWIEEWPIQHLQIRRCFRRDKRAKRVLFANLSPRKKFLGTFDKSRSDFPRRFFYPNTYFTFLSRSQTKAEPSAILFFYFRQGLGAKKKEVVSEGWNRANFKTRRKECEIFPLKLFFPWP